MCVCVCGGGGGQCDVIEKGGGIIVTVCDGGGGVQNSLNLCDVIYERPLRLLIEVGCMFLVSRKVFLCIEKNKDPFT